MSALPAPRFTPLGCDLVRISSPSLSGLATASSFYLSISVLFDPSVSAMAVLGTFEVTVSSEGRTLKEYEVEPDDPAFATDDSTPEEVNMAKYVEAIDGAGFQIKYALGRGLEFAKANYLSCWVYIDGKYMTGDALPRADYQKNQSASGTIIGATIWNGNDLRVMPFQWRELLTSGILSRLLTFILS